MNLRTTAEHPLALATGGIRLAGEVRPGDSLLVWNKRRLESAEVLALHADQDFQPVFNLEVGAPHTFIADGVVVHNKGGFSGGGYHGGGSGGSDDPTAFLLIAVGVGIYVLVKIIPERSKEDEDLDFTYSRSAIDKKALKTG